MSQTHHPQENSIEETEDRRGYCVQCASACPMIITVSGDKLVRVRPDAKHPNAADLCPKGIAMPELVSDPLRLKQPLRRTRPKGDPDPGWQPMGWDEAMDLIAERLLAVKTAYGPEAVAFARACPGGSSVGEILPWVFRLSHAFGTPNNVATTHICQWHRDQCSRYTYGNGHHPKKVVPDFQNAGCILLWGNNPNATRRNNLQQIRKGLANGARLIVIDPRRIPLAEKADIWLQIRPGSDLLLALSLIHVMMAEGLYDPAFTRDWTTAPLLVREDTGDLLSSGDLAEGHAPGGQVMVAEDTGTLVCSYPGRLAEEVPALYQSVTVALKDGTSVACKTVFALLREHVSAYSPEDTAGRTGLAASQVREAARLFVRSGPSCMYTFNGIEQTINATHTNRAVCMLYALTGCYDRKGGSVLFPEVPVKEMGGRHFLSVEAAGRRLGRSERPLGPAAVPGAVRANDVYSAILDETPYPVKALVGIGGNVLTSSPESATAIAALKKVDFHVQADLFMSPTAHYADVVLPVSTFWERWGVKANFGVRGATTHIQYRPKMITPMYASRPDIDIIFDLACRLGLGDLFWQGDIRAAYDAMLAPAGLTLSELAKAPGGVTVDGTVSYRKYADTQEDGSLRGFQTASGRIELFSQTFKDHGRSPFPVWREPSALAAGLKDEFPLLLTNHKLVQFSQGQHRSIPSLRKAVPEPRLEINRRLAEELSIMDGRPVRLRTPYGSLVLTAGLSDKVPYDTVCFQHGWWQQCDALGLPAQDPASFEGANMNLIITLSETDPISGSIQIKGCPCAVAPIG